jgi:hypothetical protein
VDQAALVTRDFDDGARLVQELDRREFPVSAAFWAFDQNVESWRLIVAAPAQTIESKSQIYGLIQSIIFDDDLEIPLSAISLVRDDDQGVRNLQADAISDIGTVFEVPIAHTEVGGRSISNVHVYRTAALRYEGELLSALQRVQPGDVVLRRASYIDLPPSMGIDFVLDNGERIAAIEAKAQSRPLGTSAVEQVLGLQSRLAGYFHRPVAVILVSKNGFTQSALQLAERTRFVRIVKWSGREDDKYLRQAMSRLFD